MDFFAQTSFGERLLSSEQIGLGGPTFGRGYDPSELTGDKGVAGKAELQYNQQLSRLGSALQYFGFYDAGVIGNSDPAAGIPHSQSLASTGGGVRFALPLEFSGSLEVDKPLTKPVEAEVIMDNPHPKDPRVEFSVMKRF